MGAAYFKRKPDTLKENIAVIGRLKFSNLNEATALELRSSYPNNAEGRRSQARPEE